MICTDTLPASSTSILSSRILQIRNSLELSAREKLIARVLLDYIGNRPDGFCWPSLARMAQEASVSVRTAQRAVKGLREKGFISIDPRHRENGGQTSSLYKWLDSLSPGGGDKLTDEHKKHQKEPSKQHVEARAVPCDLNSSEANDSERKSSKRFASFESNPDKFKSFDECAIACEKAKDAGFIQDTEQDTVLFWTLYAAICRKLKDNKVSNPARLLRFLLDSRKAMVTYCRQSDEDAAVKALKQHRRESCKAC
jgi:hypothetical protein